MDVKQQIKQLRRGVVDLIQEAQLEKKLRRGKPLLVKLGADPSSPELHLGHSVVLRKLRQFQALGHEVCFLIGDFTGMIGDPSGKSKTRPRLTREAVMENAKTYKAQLFKVLDESKTKVAYNSEWNLPLSFSQFLELASKVTVARILEREDFKTRYQTNKPISLTELVYPLVQGFDSVQLRADVELGGTDQLFNLLLGRALQREYGQEEQVVFTLPLLEGTDGVQKMSKSLGNVIALSETPTEMFGKLMSIPDSLMLRYFTLLTEVPEAELKLMEEELRRGVNPKQFKVRLAKEVVSLYHSSNQAQQALAEFERIFTHGGAPEQVPELQLPVRSFSVLALLNWLREAGVFASNSEGRRVLQGGGVRLEGQRLALTHELLTVESPKLLKVGKKKFLRLLPAAEQVG